MADVYKFKVRLKEIETIIWRDIEITSVSSMPMSCTNRSGKRR
jgi:hypothetical protein